MNQIDITRLSNDLLMASASGLAQAERNFAIEFLRYFSEIERRRAFVKLGYSSLWEYSIQSLKLS